ncbi:MAG TPA: hypothetical protein VIX19_03415 [Terriglobales bacterium]
MKPLVIFAISFLLLLVLGCTSNDKSGAGRGSSVTRPESATELAVSANVPPVVPESDPAANGGSNLAAISPYSQPNGATAQQNVNPAPFLTESAQAQALGESTAGAQLTTSGSLTSRADGTMSGPQDQPAATTGWGTAGTNWTNPAATGAKPATHPTKAPPK